MHDMCYTSLSEFMLLYDISYLILHLSSRLNYKSSTCVFISQFTAVSYRQLLLFLNYKTRTRLVHERASCVSNLLFHIMYHHSTCDTCLLIPFLLKLQRGGEEEEEEGKKEGGRSGTRNRSDDSDLGFNVLKKSQSIKETPAN